jgi:hypothetical protein
MDRRIVRRIVCGRIVRQQEFKPYDVAARAEGAA